MDHWYQYRNRTHIARVLKPLAWSLNRVCSILTYLIGCL